jgi:outer membrane immunogenic protein
MKKLYLLSTAAVALLAVSSVGQAADMPARVVKAPLAPVMVPFSWTGFYLGGNIGAAWGQRTITDNTRALAFTQTSNGRFIGGGQIGYNYQINNFLLGVEGDIDGVAHNNGDGAGIVVPGVGTIAASSNSTWVSTLAARFGIANDHWLFYGKAGGGWVGTSNLTISNVTAGTVITGNNSRTNSGFLGGVGIEYAITNNWTVKAEYDYLALSRRNFIVPVGSPFFVGDNFTNGGRNVQMVKLGFNYLFNPGAPIAARY